MINPWLGLTGFLEPLSACRRLERLHQFGTLVFRNGVREIGSQNFESFLYTKRTRARVFQIEYTQLVLS